MKHLNLKSLETPPLCECGCGYPTNWLPNHARWSRFVDGHQNIGRPSARKIDRGEPPLCQCGCREPVKTFRYGGKGWADYLNNHAPRPRHTPEAIEKMRQVALARNLTGSANPAFKDGQSRIRHRKHPGRIHKSTWKRISQIVQRRDSCQCAVCHSTRRLDVHHIDGNLENNSLENLVTLCHKHHIQAELGDNAKSLQKQIKSYMATVPS